ncbi:MAG: NAD-dependent epimerase/dehydratase family protein [Actinobacteria bacterium]|nr:NAD-dependent epimerase/dehydratase family protein [Actinomycetota bacterium]
MGRRILVTGLGTFWGGRVAQQLEASDDIDVIVGLDRSAPSIPLERTEYVRCDEDYSILARIVKAARIDTIVHTFLVVDSTQMPSRRMHEINVIGTMNLFAAAAAASSTVRSVVVKSSALVYGSDPHDPVWFTENTRRSTPPTTRVERNIAEVEAYVRDFAVDNPHVCVSMLRFSNVIGPTIVTPLTNALQLPVVPSILGFDPRFQLVHEDDVIRAIVHVLDGRIPGIFNVTGDGMLPWSEIARICGKRTVPMPPIATELAALPLRRLGVDLPDELLSLLRYGRGVDNSRLKETGFSYAYTSAGAIRAFAEALRLRSTIGDTRRTYRYERDVEQFFRHSPAVIRDEPSEVS